MNSNNKKHINSPMTDVGRLSPALLVIISTLTKKKRRVSLNILKKK